MIWDRLYKRAYELAMRCNQQLIINDLRYMNDAELSGVIYYMLKLQDC